MSIPGKKYQAGTNTYRYGYQAQESTNEMFGGTIDFKYRVEDPRIVIFLSLDPLERKYPYNTPYSVQENKFGLGREFEGLEITFFGTVGEILKPTTELVTEAAVESSKPISSIEIPVEEIAATSTNVARPTAGSSLQRWAAFGRDVHRFIQEKWRNEGFSTEETLGKFGRTDAIEAAGRDGVIRELKPNNSWGKSAGIKQLYRYLEGAKERYPLVENWKLELHLYGSTGIITSNALGTFYKISKGETLSSISSKLNIKQSSLQVLNNIKNANDIKVGEELLIGVQLSKSVSKKNKEKAEEIKRLINFIKTPGKK
jgi:hypothetical protein